MPALEDQIRAAFERVAAQTLVNPAPSFKMLDRIPVQPSEEEPATIDLETPGGTDEHRRGSKRVLVAGLLAAAVVAAIALVAIRKDDPVSPADQPSPTETAPTTETVTPTAPPPAGNPLVDIRSPLVDQSDVELFRMNSDTERYWRLTTLPEFDGRTFRLPSRGLDRLDDTGDGVEGRTIHQQIQILALTDKMVPAAAEVSQVAPNADMRLNRDTGTLIKVTDLVPGEQFTIVSREPDITVDELRAATTDNPPDEIFLGLPDDVPDNVYDTAASVTAGATTDYDRMIALQDWFRNDFEYSTEVQSGHGLNAIENFLQIRKGYCEQFAATFAVMARALGIPSRVAVGYTPGQLGSDGWYRVTGANAHAWPEIWFKGFGWVAFEPTPQRGIPGADVYTGVPAAQDESVPDLGPPEPGTATLPPTPTTVFSPPTAQTPAP
jgi:hypothetical protein